MSTSRSNNIESDFRLSRILQQMACLICVVSLSCTILWELAHAKTVRVVDTDGITSVTLPMDWVGDQRRFLRTVLQPVCTSTQEDMYEVLGEGVTETCFVDGDVVRVVWPGTVKVGLNEQKAGPEHLKAGLDEGLKKHGLAVEVDGRDLLVSSTEGLPGELILRRLQMTPAVFIGVEAAGPPPLGTGPYAVESLRCIPEGDEREWCVGKHQYEHPGVRFDWERDRLVLKHKASTLFSESPKRIIFLGARIEPEQTKEVAQQLKGLLENKPMVFWNRKPEEWQVHAVVGLNPTQNEFFQPDVDSDWVTHEAAANSVRLVVLPSEGIEEDCRELILWALDEARHSKRFLLEAKEALSVQVIPPRYKIEDVWQPPPQTRPVVKGKCSVAVALTDTASRATSVLLRQLREAAAPDLSLDLVRRKGDPLIEAPEAESMLISITLAYQFGGPKHWIWDVLESTGWGTDEHLISARALVIGEGDMGLEELLEDLSTVIVPITESTSRQVVSTSLQGLSPEQSVLDPGAIKLTPMVSLWALLGTVWGIVVPGLGVFLWARWTTHRAQVIAAEERVIAAEEREKQLTIRRIFRQWRHELLAPLAVIKAESSLIEDDEQADVLVAEADAALDLIDRARIFMSQDLSRIEDHEPTLNFETQVWGPAVAALRRRAKYESPDSSIAIKTDPLATDLSTIKLDIDPQDLGIIMNNLLLNAWRYRKEKTINTIQLDLRVSTTKETGKTIFHINISDCGRGVHMEDELLLFELGYRSEAVRQEKIPGSGLGLWICRRLARAYDGDVKLISPHSPTMFRVSIPAYTGTEA